MNKIDWDSITEWLKEQEQYPPALRIAKHVFVHGVREENFSGVYIKLLSSGVPEPIVISIQNYLRDIERGVIETLDDIPDVVV